MTASFTPPVDRLLGYGEWKVRRDPWADYLSIGLTREHVPELIRMATDVLLWYSGEGTATQWAPLHAWRALGQLHADEAAEPLARWLSDEIEDDWVMTEIPRVLGMIGRAAIAPSRELLADESADLYARWSAADALKEVATRHPDARDEAVAALVEALERWPDRTPELNAGIILHLSDLREISAAPLMEAAFAADAVDLQMGGDWQDVQVAMGLIPERTTPRPYIPPLLPLPRTSTPAPPRRARSQKNRHKAARAARKRNRRK